MKKSLTILMVVTVTLAISVSSVFAAGGAHLWFYSVDPSGEASLPNPDPWDPNYQGVSADPWVTESVLVNSGDWDTPFSIWLGCAQFESLNTMLVIIINDAAAGAIESINGVDVSLFTTSSSHPVLSPHGVFNSAEFYGYTEVPVGNLYSLPGSPHVAEITIDIELKSGAEIPEDAKIHFDAYGYTEEGSIMKNPYSHDYTFVVPELGVVLLLGASFIALGLFAVKHKKSSA